jgi:hypothetical protein
MTSMTVGSRLGLLWRLGDYTLVWVLAILPARSLYTGLYGANVVFIRVSRWISHSTDVLADCCTRTAWVINVYMLIFFLEFHLKSETKSEMHAIVVERLEPTTALAVSKIGNIIFLISDFAVWIHCFSFSQLMHLLVATPWYACVINQIKLASRSAWEVVLGSSIAKCLKLLTKTHERKNCIQFF